jgi:hypothetical protein
VSRLVVIALLAGVAIPDGAAAQSRDEGALFLLLPVGAHSVGVARAMTALPTPEGAFWNPAGLAWLESPRILVFRGEHFAGAATGLSGLLPVSDRGMAGLSYVLLDSGTQQLTDGTGEVLGFITIRQHQAVLSGAATLSRRWSIGGNAKLVEFRQSCSGRCPDAGVRATTWAGDVGIQYRPRETGPLSFGLLAAHLGPGLSVEGVEGSDPLPARLRLGASYTLRDELAEEELMLQFLLELEDRLRAPGSPALLLGTELAFGTEDQVSIRGGYILGSHTETDGAAVGLGLRYERFELGIARSLARGGPTLEQEPVHLTLGFTF